MGRARLLAATLALACRADDETPRALVELLTEDAREFRCVQVQFESPVTNVGCIGRPNTRLNRPPGPDPPDSLPLDGCRGL